VRPGRPDRSKIRSAFTLIELLVVIAIIALLVSILLPSLAEAREQAKQVKCAAHLAGIGRGVQVCFTEYKGYGPGWDDGEPGGPIGHMEFMLTWADVLFDHKMVGDPRAQLCPSDQRPDWLAKRCGAEWGFSFVENIGVGETPKRGVRTSFAINAGALILYRYFMGTKDVKYYTSRLGTLVLWIILTSSFLFLAYEKHYATMLWGGVTALMLLGGFLVALLYASAVQRGPASLLDAVTPPRRPNLAAWLVVLVPFLAAGWAGYHLPGDGASSPQSDLLFGGLAVFGLVWPPLVSALIGARVVAALVREGW